jgi:carbamate kinase
MATDAPGVYADYGTPEQRLLTNVTPEELERYEFAAGSMGPKVEAAIRFARETGKCAAIGSLEDIERIVAGEAGTRVSNEGDFEGDDSVSKQRDELDGCG